MKADRPGDAATPRRVRGPWSCEPEQKPVQPAVETLWGLVWGFLRLCLAAEPRGEQKGKAGSSELGEGAPAVPLHHVRPPRRAWQGQTGSARGTGKTQGKTLRRGRSERRRQGTSILTCSGFLWAGGGHGSAPQCEIKARSPAPPSWPPAAAWLVPSSAGQAHKAASTAALRSSP